MKRKLGAKDFSFHVGKYQIIGSNSEAAKKAYFESKSLDLSAGYAVLFGQNPDFTETALTADVDGIKQESNYFARRLTTALKRERIEKGLFDSD
jgi:hypothetical protein